MNKVMLTGRLVREIELNTYGKGKNGGTWTAFTLAVNDGKNAEGEAKTQFIECKAFNKTAELLEEFVEKGDLVMVFGKVANESWEDDKGDRKYAQRVICDGIELFPNNRKEEAKDKKYKK